MLREYISNSKNSQASQWQDKRASPAIDSPGCFCCKVIKGAAEKCCAPYHDKFNL